MDTCPHAPLMDEEIAAQAASLVLPSPSVVLNEVRGILYKYQETQAKASNNVIALIKTASDRNGSFLIELGPQIDKGPTPGHFHFDSGARLSFGITLNPTDKKHSRVLSYRFHYVAANGRNPEFLRLDLNGSTHPTPLQEPRCHIHPGHEHVRIPSPVLVPSHALEIVLHVIAHRV